MCADGAEKVPVLRSYHWSSGGPAHLECREQRAITNSVLETVMVAVVLVGWMTRTQELEAAFQSPSQVDRSSRDDFDNLCQFEGLLGLLLRFV